MLCRPCCQVVRRTLFCAGVLASRASLHSQELKIPDIPDTPEALNIAPAPSERFPAKWYPGQGDGTNVVLAPVLDRPYLGLSETHNLRARDRFGRTRTEAVTGGGTTDGVSYKIKDVSVTDPVSHCDFHWMERVPDRELPVEERLAFVTCAPLTLRYKDLDVSALLMNGISVGTTTHGDTTTKVERPATILMEGLTVQRMRVTNSVTGADGTVKTWVTETWYSPRLKEVLRIGGDEDGSFMLSGISETDPDPRLFYPPEGYRIEAQKAR